MNTDANYGVQVIVNSYVHSYLDSYCDIGIHHSTTPTLYQL